MKQLFFKGSFVAFALFVFINPSQAQIVTQNITLDFGRFVLLDNSGVHRLQLQTNCMASPDPEFLIITDPKCGDYTVTGYPPFTPLTITLSNTPLNGSGSNNFILANLRTIPTTITTDALGEASFEVRGELQTTGTGGTYIDGRFIGTFTMMISP